MFRNCLGPHWRQCVYLCWFYFVTPGHASLPNQHCSFAWADGLEENIAKQLDVPVAAEVNI